MHWLDIQIWTRVKVKKVEGASPDTSWLFMNHQSCGNKIADVSYHINIGVELTVMVQGVRNTIFIREFLGRLVFVEKMISRFCDNRGAILTASNPDDIKLKRIREYLESRKHGGSSGGHPHEKKIPPLVTGFIENYMRLSGTCIAERRAGFGNELFNTSIKYSQCLAYYRSYTSCCSIESVMFWKDWSWETKNNDQFLIKIRRDLAWLRNSEIACIWIPRKFLLRKVCKSSALHGQPFAKLTLSL